MLHNIKQWLSDEANFASFKLAIHVACVAITTATLLTLVVLSL